MFIHCQYVFEAIYLKRFDSIQTRYKPALRLGDAAARRRGRALRRGGYGAESAAKVCVYGGETVSAADVGGETLKDLLPY